MTCASALASRCSISSGSHEGDVFVGEIQPGLDIGEEVEQVVAQLLQRASHAAGELFERLLQLIARAGFDDGVNGLGASQIELAGQEGSQRELAGLGGAAAGLQQLRDQQLHQRRAGERVNLGDILSGVAVRRGPEVHVRRQRSQIRQSQMTRQ